jgi:hypothetical protein
MVDLQTIEEAIARILSSFNATLANDVAQSTSVISQLAPYVALAPTLLVDKVCFVRV